ncbi:hypothetical protein [Streptosporangium sp. NPDC087985]|uniref:hypothetical protein n=1 Tax=Streptosporangium sp. NPDC087985 TaxID=3366196 RepID=UPI0038130560
MASVYGSIVGALVVVWLPYYASDWGQYIPFVGDRRATALASVIYAALLLVIIFTMPGGAAAGLRNLCARFLSIIPRPPRPHASRAQSARPAAEATERDLTSSTST